MARQPTNFKRPDISELSFSKAIICAGLALNVDSRPRENEVDTLRLLTQSQFEISESDLSKFWSEYNRPVAWAEYMISRDLIQLDHDTSDSEGLYPALAAVLKVYYKCPLSQWESVLRLLLRKEANLHLPVPRDLEMESLNHCLGPKYPCKILQHGTPLDELFLTNKTPFEGKAAADQWLAFLSCEGYDVKAYIEEEQALHAAQMQLTYPSPCE